MNSNHKKTKDQAKQSRDNLLLAAAIVTMALPIFLALTQKLLGQRVILDSISAYYYSGSRDIFVGFLFAICAILFIYHGKSKKENTALNLAGFFGIVVALVPTQSPELSCEFACSAGFSPYCIHTIAALAFFVCLAYVSFFCFCDEQGHSAAERHEHDIIHKRYEPIFKLIAGLLLLFPILSAAFATGFLESDGKCSNLLFWAEFLAIYSLGAMWIIRYKENLEIEKLSTYH